MSATPINPPPIQEVSLRPPAPESFHAILDEQHAAHFAAQQAQHAPQFVKVAFDAVDHIDKQRASLAQDTRSGDASDPAAMRRFLVKSFDYSIEITATSGVVLQAGHAIKATVQQQ
jgi:hypothetical protein